MQPKLLIKQTEHKGRGVFACQDIKSGAIIEACQIIVLDAKYREYIDCTPLYNYYFSWGRSYEKIALALGSGSLYNHSYKPNAMYIKDFSNNILTIQALSNISNGQEITVNYNGEPLNQKPVWFKVRYD